MTTPTPEAIKIQPWPKLFTTLSITGDDGSEIFAIVGDGTVRGTIENTGPAAQRFMDELRGMTEAVAAQAKGEAFQAVRDAAEVEPDQVGDYGMVELPGYLTIDTRAFDALDKDDRERLHITADDYAQAIDDARAQAKAEALREAADSYMGEWPFMRKKWGGNDDAEANSARDVAMKTMAWLQQQAETAEAATIEGKSE